MPTFVITKMDMQQFVVFVAFFVRSHNCDLHGFDEPALNEPSL
jgi:hypothetical protein